jgi:hypothetical protein
LSWVKTIRGRLSSEVIGIDGKVLRHSGNEDGGKHRYIW